MTDDNTSQSWLGRLGWIWGMAGFLGLMIFAIARLAPIALNSLQQSLDWRHWLVFAVNLMFMAYYEGYKGFQKGYSPRVVARAEYLRKHPTLLSVALAPAFCMAYFHATRRRIISAWALTIAIIILILLFTQLPEPWKGLLDAGVVLGLSWGVVATVIVAVQVLTGARAAANPELPEPAIHG